MPSVTKRKSQHGFAMIEVLVTAVIIAIGLSGLGVLLMRAIQGTQDSSQHSQAMWIVQDFAGRIRANPIGARQETYETNAIPANYCKTRPNPVCASYFDNGNVVDPVDCTPADMANFDRWDMVCGMIIDLKPGDTGYNPEDVVFDAPAEFIVNPVLTSTCSKSHVSRISTPSLKVDCVQYLVTLTWSNRVSQGGVSRTSSYSTLVELN